MRIDISGETELDYSSPENRGLNLVALGGGTGLSTLLAGLKRLVGETSELEKPSIANLAAIVTVSDDGGSSGRLARRVTNASARRHSKLHDRAF